MRRLLGLLVDREAVHVVHERPVVRVEELLARHSLEVLVAAEAVHGQVAVRIGRREHVEIGRPLGVKQAAVAFIFDLLFFFSFQMFYNSKFV